jgi:hypothetical protein
LPHFASLPEPGSLQRNYCKRVIAKKHLQRNPCKGFFASVTFEA